MLPQAGVTGHGGLGLGLGSGLGLGMLPQAGVTAHGDPSRQHHPPAACSRYDRHGHGDGDDDGDGYRPRAACSRCGTSPRVRSGPSPRVSAQGKVAA